MVYDRFQTEAIDFINQGFSVIVAAPTGAGKTAIAEHVIKEAAKQKTGVIYTAPIKALSNQKFRDLQKQFGETIGIVTGDVSINPQAPVLIMTTEIFRNKILDDPRSLAFYAWVIFDEIHYIDNPERGTVWEESLMFLPDHMRLLGLSATIPNIGQFAGWLEAIHHKAVKIVREDKRPVPLHILFQCQDKIQDSISYSRASYYSKVNRLTTLVNYLEQKSGFPAIYFVFSRRRAEKLAFELSGRCFLQPNEKQEVTSLYKSLCKRFDLESEESANILLPLIQRGIAYHHAGMLPTLKEVIERLFTSRLLKMIFTTETFALGINMPSRSVIFDDLRKVYGRYSRDLKTRDFYQMAGRAGRRGIDTEGFVYCRIHPDKIRPEEIQRIVSGKPEDAKSQFNTSYATVLNLFEKHRDKLLNIYPLSFHFCQSRPHEQKETLRLLEAKIKLLKNTGFIENEGLSIKGKFAKTIYGYELLLGELYGLRALEQLDPCGLAALVAALVFQPRKNQRNPFELPRTLRHLKQLCEKTILEINAKEQKNRIYPVSKKAYWHLATAADAWIKGADFYEILKLTDIDEGEIIRCLRMAQQVLKEIALSPHAGVTLKEKIFKTIRSLNRGAVNAEKQLKG
ncbi:MAG: hypothetical protein COX96_08700 [Candidatus Omnitrophica bacterium CG_4_10_14_0_2_um_filter_44_9]|nr:MAG: hypothetical protein COY78_04420 [Candidatus Omnitrophica bacterium CG_4_10_14_0_8_um_filter_44_12]PIZ83213.1 MAG: hypothetical protein COX96_08700 [Candidatus Omnitrophica bacterium CG_4_10_14_0_2_um_filter_44_9]